jgi:hypothetical protein
MSSVELIIVPTPSRRAVSSVAQVSRLYFRPFVLGHGTPFFAGPRPPLRLVASDPIGEDTIRLTYVPA